MSVTMLLAVALAAAAPQTWFAPLPVLPRVETRQYVGSVDFMSLFTPKARWQQAAKRVRVFKLYGEWVAYTATRAQLRRVVTDLRRRKIALAVEAGPIRRDAACGEQLAWTDEGLRIANRLRGAGADLRFVAFDEPYYYGALARSPKACAWSDEQLALAVAEYVADVRRVFPRAAFGDIEPVTSARDVEAYKRWIDVYRATTAEAFAFLHVDLHYSIPRWPQLVRELERFARSRGIPFGLIYFGDHDAASDEAWSAKAQERFEAYENEGGVPDQIVFQSWQDRPDRVLPETLRGTFTNLVNRYFRPRTRLSLELAGGKVAGRLIAGRRLVPSAPLTLAVSRSYEPTALPPRPTGTTTTTTDSSGRYHVALGPLSTGSSVTVRYAGSTAHWSASATATTGAALRNVARGSAATASSAAMPSPPRFAVDGDVGTWWSAGAFAPQWIELDFGAPTSVVEVRLMVDQFPAGNTVHAVLGRGADGDYRLLHEFRASTSTGSLLEHAPPTAWTGIRFLRVHTSASPSWVAWREIEIVAG